MPQLRRVAEQSQLLDYVLALWKFSSHDKIHTENSDHVAHYPEKKKDLRALVLSHFILMNQLCF